MPAPLWTHTTKWLGDTSIIWLSGELDLSAHTDVRELFTEELRHPELTRLHIDLSAVTFMDSTVLGALLYAYNATENSDRQLTIAPSEFVRRILNVTGLSHLFVIADR
ncbi:STAS domain-containing protein [Micromonospora sp. CA-244673]|uniref:STAS domain-containing protein n=1 Tax=Micromonospora sp. CA-244673 TaxID=3239958 RepID=UPI003D8D8CE7